MGVPFTASDPPGSGPSSGISTFSRFLLQIGGIIGAVLGAAQALAAPYVGAILKDAYNSYPNVPLSPAEAAVGSVKNSYPDADWVYEAQLSGLNAERFQALVEMTGNPPGPETLLEMVNRGIITVEQAQIGMAQGLLRNDWSAQYLGLQRNILSAADYVQAEVQGVQPALDWQSKAASAGLDPNEYATALWIAGNPPGPTESLTMWNRGIFDQATTEQALRESRLKDKYIPQFLQLARHRIPMRTINTLLTHGIIDKPTAETYLTELGFTATDAAYLSAGATALTAAAHKNISAAKVIQMYEDHITPAATAVTSLGNLGYDAATAQELLTLADEQARLKYVNSAITAIRTRFISRRISDAVATADLSTFQVDPTQAAALIQLWKVEQDANITAIPLTNLLAIIKAGLVTTADATTRLEQMGFTATDAALLINLEIPPGTTLPAAPPAAPTV